MRYHKNNWPDMVLGEVRTAAIDIRAPLDEATVSGTPTYTCASAGLTFGTVTNSSGVVSVPVTAAKAGKHVIVFSASTSASETLKGFHTCNVIDPANCIGSSSDYQP